MAGYRITKLAQADLEQIWAYTADEWSTTQAEIYLDALFACFEAISDGRKPGQNADNIRSGYRKLKCQRHYVFYRVDASNVAEIIRVLHVSMDVESHL